MESDLLDIKIVHIFVVSVASLAGMTIPVYFSQTASMNTMFLLRSFSTGVSSISKTAKSKITYVPTPGVILALAFCHMLPDSADLANMTNYGGLNGALMLLGVVLNLSAERLSIDLAQMKIVRKKSEQIMSKMEHLVIKIDLSEIDTIDADVPSRVVEPADPSHMNPSESPDVSHRCHNTADIIEFGVVIHTIIIGVSVGTWRESRGALIIFTVAMAFHQLFEGIGLGTVAANPSLNLPRTKQIVMISIFTLSFPISICIGIYLYYSSTDPADYALISGARLRVLALFSRASAR
jgi:hypothetical protein